ncbi:MAG: Gfo/Idh/MocA family oxidoreductase [Gemmatimonadaceae bacterium]|nr:Gfo/Idh/MocA family oxidoreductase [Gemmatimonadaceae bacterium]
MSRRLGIGFVGSGFNTRFHITAFRGVRDADVLGVWSPNRERAESAAAHARALDVGECKAYGSITEMVADPAINAIWLSGPNQSRVENVEEIVRAIESGVGTLDGLACEKPLARNVAEAVLVRDLAKRVGLVTGYLENQLFAPHVEAGKQLLWARGAASTGRPYLARAAEEHAGPHAPWFWQGKLQGGGVLNDMMCHSALLVRHLLTKPGEPLSTVRPTAVTGQIASLKWSRPEYVQRLKDSMGESEDYARTPSEDFASVTIEFETAEGHRALGEATTSWSYVGPGLRLSAELLGPEYSMQWNSLDSGLKLFFSREVRGSVGEDLVEKQNAELGMMPVIPNEAAAYGYEGEDRHFVRAFLGKERPLLTFDDGLDVVTMLMSAYRSAEERRTVPYPAPGVESFVPAVARGEWKP